jgi:hypothetical protein
MRLSVFASFAGLAGVLIACSESSDSPGAGNNTAGMSGGSSGGATSGSGGSATSTGGEGGSAQGGQSAGGGAGGAETIADASAAGSGGSAGTSSEGGALDAAKSTMTFFITSTGSGAMGGNLGGVTGADKKCQDLATAVGGGDHTWHAYLSVGPGAPGGTVNAKDRVGAGPWHNQKGTLIAANLTDLHNPATNMINATNGLDEKGGTVPGRGQTALPNEHDILTGSNPDGTVFMGDTCNEWTSSTTGTAYVGHFDRMGTNPPPASMSWNSAHAVNGCTEAALKSTGGAGRLYCFAID